MLEVRRALRGERRDDSAQAMIHGLAGPSAEREALLGLPAGSNHEPEIDGLMLG